MIFSINILFLFLLIHTSESNKIKNQISFKNFIRKKSLETSYNGNSDVVEILNNVKDCAVQINKILSLSFLETIYLPEKQLNVHQEKQKKLDLLSNSIIKNAILSNQKVNSLCSEEEMDEKIIQLRSGKKLIFVYDPLDGSSNIESCMSVGTIFGLYQDNINFEKSIHSINKMNNMVLGGYILYSSSVHLVFYLDYDIYHFI